MPHAAIIHASDATLAGWVRTATVMRMQTGGMVRASDPGRRVYPHVKKAQFAFRMEKHNKRRPIRWVLAEWSRGTRPSQRSVRRAAVCRRTLWGQHTFSADVISIRVTGPFSRP